jgi:hypothetical protein
MHVLSIFFQKKKKKALHNTFLEIHNTSALCCPSTLQFKALKIITISGVKIIV